MRPSRAAPRLDKLLVIGVGLIGGSFAAALRAAGCAERIVGIGRARANLDDARRSGLVDATFTLDADWAREARDADLVLLATPVTQYPALLSALAGQLGPRTVVTDAGSTKQDVVAAAAAALGPAVARFVPGHPIAGSERSGAAAADARLFRDREVILTPTSATDPAAQALVTALWQAAGARVTTLSAEAHDRVLATVSHLPHLVAFALMDLIATRADPHAVLAHAGSGLRDVTRIAASSPSMWRDIALANRAALADDLDAYAAGLARMAESLAAADGAALLATFERAAATRRAWSASTAFPSAASGDDDA